MRVLCPAMVVLLALLVFARSSFPQDNLCDPNLRTNKTNPNSYRLRDNDRCEGVYIEGQSGSANLLIGSFTEVFEDYSNGTGQPLIIDWTAPTNSRVRLRAYSLRQKYYYRMDTYRSVDQSSFSWPISILAALGLPKDQVGIVGWTQYQIGAQSRDLYLPLRVKQQTHASRAKGFQLVIVPRVELKEVRMSLNVVGNDGRLAEALKTDQKLIGDFYPANRRFSVPIPELKKPGIYFLSLGAVLKKGGSATTEIWFYNGK